MKVLLEDGEMTHMIESYPLKGYKSEGWKGDLKIQVVSSIEMSVLGKEGREEIMAMA